MTSNIDASLEETLSYIAGQLKTLTSIASPTGYTRAATDYLMETLRDMGFGPERSNKGNVLVELGGEGEPLVLASHVDTLGAMVRSIKDNGRLRPTTLGGHQWSTADGENCTVYTRDGNVYTGVVLNTEPSAHVADEPVKTIEKNMEILLDENVDSKDDVLELGIQTGDIIAMDPRTTVTESGYIKSRFLDDKLSVGILLGFAKYLHDSLPNATYVGFTGTPVDGTIEVFGGVVDAYTMTEAVKDGITVNLVYDGRAAKVMLNQDKVRQIEEYYAQCELEGANEHQVEESQKAVAKMEVIIGDPDRLRAVAEDFIKHYETRVAEGATVAGKAMFVCSNRNIAYDFYKIVKELRPEWTEKKICDDGVVLSEKDKKELKPMEKIKLVMTRNKDDEKDLFDMLGTKEDRKEFDRQFKNQK